MWGHLGEIIYRLVMGQALTLKKIPKFAPCAKTRPSTVQSSTFQPGLAAVLIITCPSQSPAALVVLIPAGTKAQRSGVAGASHIRRGLD